MYATPTFSADAMNSHFIGASNSHFTEIYATLDFRKFAFGGLRKAPELSEGFKY